MTLGEGAGVTRVSIFGFGVEWNGFVVEGKLRGNVSRSASSSVVLTGIVRWLSISLYVIFLRFYSLYPFCFFVCNQSAGPAQFEAPRKKTHGND